MDRLWPKSRRSESTDETRSEARRALDSARTGQVAVDDNKERVARVAHALKVQRDRNHFGELIETTLRGN